MLPAHRPKHISCMWCSKPPLVSCIYPRPLKYKRLARTSAWRAFRACQIRFDQSISEVVFTTPGQFHIKFWFYGYAINLCTEGLVQWRSQKSAKGGANSQRGATSPWEGRHWQLTTGAAVQNAALWLCFTTSLRHHEVYFIWYACFNAIELHKIKRRPVSIPTKKKYDGCDYYFAN